MRVLITRPHADAARTAAALRGRGHEPIIAPLLTIEILPDADLGTEPWTAILVTSANAVPGIAGRRELHDVPALTVGERSAAAMREAGFSHVIAADGNVTDLANLVAARMKPPACLLYLAGEERSGDLAAALRAKHFSVRTVLVYRAVAAQHLPREAIDALAAGIDGILHFSRRSAEAYVNAVGRSGLREAALIEPLHFCLSVRIAEPLARAGAAKIRTAATPDEAALLALCG